MKFVIYYGKNGSRHEGQHAITTKKSEKDMLEKYHNMNYHDRKEWKRIVVKACSVIVMQEDSGFLAFEHEFNKTIARQCK